MCDKQSGEVQKIADEIVDILNGIRANPSKRSRELVFFLEDRAFLEQEFKINLRNTKQYKHIELRYRAFCNAYLMKIFLEFIADEYDAEIILMLYGYIQGFEAATKEEGYTKYWEHAHTYIERINRKGESKPHILHEERKLIIRELATTLAIIKLNSDGKLDFAKDILEEFSNNVIPEKLSLPITKYFTHAYMQPKKQTEEDDKQNVSPDKPDTDNCDKMVAPSDNGSKPEKLPNQPKNPDIDPYDPCTEPTSIQGKMSQKDGHGDKTSKAIYVMSATILVAGSIIACTIWRTGKVNANDNIMASTASAENLSSAEHIPIDDALLVEMETFSIDEDDKIIPLAPGYSKELPIKDISPPNADISTLEVQSSDESIVWEKDGYLTASDNIPAGESLDIYVTITAKNHREIICVQVENPEIPDDAEGAVGSGRQPDY